MVLLLCRLWVCSHQLLQLGDGAVPVPAVGPAGCLCLELVAGWGGSAQQLPQAGLCCPQV